MSASELVAWILNAVQLVTLLIAWLVRSAHHKHLAAMRQQCQHLRAACTEAISSGEVIKTDGSRQFVRNLAYGLLGIESHVDAIIGKPKPSASQTSAGQP